MGNDKKTLVWFDSKGLHFASWLIILVAVWSPTVYEKWMGTASAGESTVLTQRVTKVEAKTCCQGNGRYEYQVNSE